MHKNSVLLYVGLACTAAVLVTSGYLGIRKYQLEKAVAELQALQTGEIEEGAAIDPLKLLQTSLAAIDKEQIYWSDIIPELEKTVPRLAETGEPVLNFASFSSNETGTISVSGVTRQGATDPLSDLALTIRAFRNHPGFLDVFVPSVSASISEGGELFNFSMTLRYEQPEL